MTEPHAFASGTATATRPPSPVFNLPNQLTAARLVLSVALFVCIAYEYWIGSTVVFAAAALTDWLDGYIARRWGLGSPLGRNFDPLVDKVLICGAYIFLLPYGHPGGWLVPWMVTVVVARELIITGLRSFLENQGAVFGADWLGKIKMVLQCAALIAIFVALYVAAPDWSEGVRGPLALIRDVLIWAMLVATALSGLQYIWKALAML